MFFAIILLVHTILLPSTLLYQCATAKRPANQRKSQRSTKSRKSSRRSRRRNGRSRKSSRSGKSSRSSKSGRSSKSSNSTKTTGSKSSKSSRSQRSNKSNKMVTNPKGFSDRKIRAAILADQKAAADAVKSQKLSSNNSSEKQLNAHNDNKISYVNVRVIPHELIFPPIGGMKHVRVKNSTGKPIAYMAKCSDNILFRINPVYGIIDTDRDAQINILRENGAAKHDKLVIVTTVHHDANKTAQHTFSQLNQGIENPNYNVNVVPLLTQ